MDAVGDMSVTAAQGFWLCVCADPIEAMEQAISLGIDTILLRTEEYLPSGCGASEGTGKPGAGGVSPSRRGVASVRK